MPSSGKGPEILLDTSAAVALVLQDHEGHAATLRQVRGRRLGLAGHAWFETYSVLTRLPGAARRPPVDVERLLASAFPQSRFLDPDAAEVLTTELARSGIAGGAVYDALVGAVARESRVPLMSRDLRATRSYELLGVTVELVA